MLTARRPHIRCEIALPKQTESNQKQKDRSNVEYLKGAEHWYCLLE